MKFRVIVFLCMIAQGMLASIAFAGRMVPDFDSLHARYIPAEDEDAQKRIGVEGLIAPRPDIAPALLALNLRVDAIINGNEILTGPNHRVQFLMGSQMVGRYSRCDVTAFDLVRIRLESAMAYLKQYQHWGNGFFDARNFSSSSVLKYALEALTVWTTQMYNDLRREYGYLLDGREDELIFEVGEEELQRSLIEANAFFHRVARRFQYQIIPLVDYFLGGLNTLPERERSILLSEMNEQSFLVLWKLLRSNQADTHVEDAQDTLLRRWIPFLNEVQQGLIWRLAQQSLLQEHLYYIFYDLDQNLQAAIRQQADPLDEGLGSIYDRVLNQLQKLYRLVRVRNFIDHYDDTGFVLRILELQRLIFQQIEVHLRAFVGRAQGGSGDVLHLRDQRALDLRTERLFQQYFPDVTPYDINLDTFDHDEDVDDEEEEELDSEEDGEDDDGDLSLAQPYASYSDEEGDEEEDGSESSGEEESESMDTDDDDGLDASENILMDDILPPNTTESSTTRPFLGGPIRLIYPIQDVQYICD